MRILYVDDNHTYHRNDELDLELERRGYEVMRVPKFDERKAQNVDVVWVEMVTENALRATQADFKAPLVVRLSAMEIYKGRINSLDWRRVDRFLVEGQHLADYFLERWGPLLEPDRIIVFPTGVDMKAFPIRAGKPNKRLAVVSQVHWRKGVQLIPDVLAAIPDGYRVDLIGKVVDHDAMNYLAAEVKRRGLAGRLNYVSFVWPRAKLVQWLHGRTYLLHTSYTEGLSRAVNEAMAVGLMPLVHRYRGVEEQYPAEYIWDEPGDVAAMLERAVESGEYRRFAKRNYSLERAGERAEAVLRGL